MCSSRLSQRYEGDSYWHLPGVEEWLIMQNTVMTMALLTFFYFCRHRECKLFKLHVYFVEFLKLWGCIKYRQIEKVMISNDWFLLSFFFYSPMRCNFLTVFAKVSVEVFIWKHGNINYGTEYFYDTSSISILSDTNIILMGTRGVL